MDNQDSNDSSEAVHYNKIEIPQCEVVIEETEETSVLVDASEISDSMITYVVIPEGVEKDGIIINYCEPEIEEDAFIPDDDIESQNQCALCRETFKNCFLLQEHFSSSHVDSDLTCRVCRLQCTTDLQLMRHYNKHKYSCNLCQASFGKYDDLLNHRKTHSVSVLPYACNICNEAYSSTREISMHIREKHNSKRTSDSAEGNKNKKVANGHVVQILKQNSS